MRILLSNPDTIGDVVLRQPMFRALAEEGHELMLVVRPILAPIMDAIAPGARVVTCDANVYSPRVRPGSEALDEVEAAARAFEPEMFVVAPYQWTVLEERLAWALRGVRVVAMSGRPFVDPQWGPLGRSVIEPHVTVEVAHDLAEVTKNERLAAAVLGRSVRLGDPVLSPGEAILRLGESELAKRGLEPGGYWAACVGDSPVSRIRNWQPERWAEFLAGWAGRHGRKFLFIGLESEAETVGRVRGLMGEASAATCEWAGGEQGDLDTLMGLVAHSSGYVGRDTGPMHIAAALGKPVLAVFGGGTWPRFLPQVDPSVAITVGVPCAGCEWRSHLRESYCIKRVPVSEVTKAAEELESGAIGGREARVIPAEPALLATIARESAEAARERLVEVSVLRRRLMEANVAMKQEAGVRVEADEAAFTPDPRSAAWNEPRYDESLSRLQAKINEATRRSGEHAATIESLREQLGDTKARVREAENRLEKRTGELLAATAELAAIKERSNQVLGRHAEAERKIEAMRQKQEEMAAELSEARAKRAEAQRWEQAAANLPKTREELALLKQRINVLTDELHTSRADALNARAQLDGAQRRLAEIGEGNQSPRLAEAMRRLGTAEAELHDLRVKTGRLEAERAALVKLTQQQETQIATCRSRLNDLLASRWRRLGQRLHLAMTLPWEKDLRKQ